MPRLCIILVLLLATILSPAQNATVVYWSLSRSAEGVVLKQPPETVAGRREKLRAMFETAGCRNGRLTEETVLKKNTPGENNLICILPGISKKTIFVLAHYQLRGKGLSVVDDWSGAIMLPFLYQSLTAAPRNYTFVFAEISGSSGAKTFARSLTKQQRSDNLAVVDLDSLGVGAARWFLVPDSYSNWSIAERNMAQVLQWAATINNAGPIAFTDAKIWMKTDDTERLRWAGMPSIVIHSIAGKDYRLPGSEKDTASAIDLDEYYRTYHLLCTYLILLDRAGERLDSELLLGNNAGLPKHTEVVPDFSFHGFPQ